MTAILSRRAALSCMASCVAAATLVHPMNAQPADALVMEKVTIRDPMVNNRDAVTFLKPRGWTVEGGVKWYPNHWHLACLEMKVKNPASLEQIETLPWCNLCWFTRPVIAMPVGHNYMGSIVHPVIDDPREVIRRITIPQLRQGATITGYQEMPEVARALSAANGGARVRAGRTRIEYTVGGQPVEEDIYLSISVTSADLGGGNIAYQWGPAWTPFSLRAAKGQLDARTGLMLAAAQSAQLDPRWFAEYCYVSQLFQERMRQGIRNAAIISETVRRNSDEIFKMYSDAYWQRQASQDRIYQNFSDYIRGVTRYQCPHHRYPVQLPSGYRNAWVNSSGYYLLTNEESDPNVGSTQTWTRLQQAR